MRLPGWFALVWEIAPQDRVRRARAHVVTLAAPDVPFPDACPVCGNPATTVVEVSYEASVRGNRRCCRVPYCAEHAAEIRRRKRIVACRFVAVLAFQLGLAGISGAAALHFAMAPEPELGLVHVFRLLPVATMPLVLRWIWLAYRRCWYVGVRIVGVDPMGTRVDLLVDEPGYAARLRSGVTSSRCEADLGSRPPAR